MANPSDDQIAQSEVFTLHWEGPSGAEPAPEYQFPDSPHEALEALVERRLDEMAAIRRAERGADLWREIRREAGRRGGEELWSRKLQAYEWVKLRAEGTANDYAKREDLNHATVRSWIAEVSKLAYQVGYRLHEDRLLLVGDAPSGLRRLRELVNRDASGEEAWIELGRVERRFRGEDPYFHLNEGHVLRARGRLRESDDSLREGLAIAEARPVRALLWNARGQTWWDCREDSSHPLDDHLDRAEKAFRRAAVLDHSTYFPFVNLAHLAADASDAKRCEYWMGELGTARKRMSEEMQNDLAKYLNEAGWTASMEERRFWRAGPARWLREAFRKGVLPLLALLLTAGLLAAAAPHARAASDAAPVSVENDGRRGGSNSGAGGN